MNAFYEWLYDHYADPQMDEAMLPQVYQEQKEAWLIAAKMLPPCEQLLCADLLESLKCHWGTLSFACGIQAGFMLADMQNHQPDHNPTAVPRPPQAAHRGPSAVVQNPMER